MSEIIIDKIDVSGCIHFNKNFENICEIYRGKIYYCFCKQYADCYYKQLQRAKAEIEALKQSEQEGLEIVTELREKNKRLTCKILEEAALNNTLCSNCEQCEDLRKIQAENERLRECINKIKEMLQNEHPFQDCSCGQDILDKISEAENDNN